MCVYITSPLLPSRGRHGWRLYYILITINITVNITINCTINVTANMTINRTINIIISITITNVAGACRRNMFINII